MNLTADLISGILWNEINKVLVPWYVLTIKGMTELFILIKSHVDFENY